MTLAHRLPLRAAGILLLASLAACQAEPRSIDFFVANEAEAKRVQDGCSAGSIRGPECESAQTALAMIAASRALEYKPTPPASTGNP